jgi:hypothetical protein
MAERIQFLSIGGRGFNVYEVQHWWDADGVLTLALHDEQYVTFVGPERNALLQWLHGVSFVLPSSM